MFVDMGTCPHSVPVNRSAAAGAHRAPIAGGAAVEPAPAGSCEHALLGVTKFPGWVGQRDVRIAQVVLGDVTTKRIYQSAERQDFVR
jgi:hypothetical protein